MTLTAWALTTGEAGMRTQARGLARAVADVVVEKTLPRRLAWPWRDRPPAADDVLAPPWPDILISCGRRSAAKSIAIRAASGGRTLTVHVQDPRLRASAFDLVIAMAHDRIAADDHVIKVATAVHDLTAENLDDAARRWAGRFAHLGRPLAGVAIGGDLKGRAFTRADGRRLITGLARLRAGADAALAITPSRRTPPAVRALLAEAFANDPRVFLWDMEGENPYRAILALSDRLVVTSDSVSMVSEAVFASDAVEVFDLGFARHAGFVSRLVAEGLVRRFEGDPTPPRTTGPVDATKVAAAAVRDLLLQRERADQDRPAVPGPASPR